MRFIFKPSDWVWVYISKERFLAIGDLSCILEGMIYSKSFNGLMTWSSNLQMSIILVLYLMFLILSFWCRWWFKIKFFKERGNDENQLAKPHDSLHMPIGPITRTNAKRIKETSNIKLSSKDDQALINMI